MQFAAFYDPSVNFELEFDVAAGEEERSRFGRNNRLSARLKLPRPQLTKAREKPVGPKGRWRFRRLARFLPQEKLTTRGGADHGRRRDQSASVSANARPGTEKEKQAEQNRLTFGRSKTEKALTKALNEKAAKTLDHGRLEQAGGRLQSTGEAVTTAAAKKRCHSKALGQACRIQSAAALNPL